VAAAAIELHDVYKRYRIYRQRYQSVKEILVHRRLGEWQDHWALRGLDLQVRPGTTVGLVGPNGAGKSTTLKLMARILAPDRGWLKSSGRVSGLLELGAGFQLEYSGRENIFLNASLLGLTRKHILSRLDEIIAFSELEPFIDDPLRTYSSGMYMRLAFAIAINVDPEVLLVDEIFAVGDQSFQQKCLNWLGGFQHQGGTIVMVTHNLGTVQEMCTEAAWIEHGRLLDLGPPQQVVNNYVDRVRETDLQRREKESNEPIPPSTPIEIERVRLVDALGEPVGSVAAGEKLVIDITYRINTHVRSPRVGVSVFRNDGVYLYGINTGIDRVSIPEAKGEGCIRLTYRSVNLLAGLYRLSIGIFDGQQEERPIVFHDKIYGFRVTSDVQGEQGLVRLDHKWELRPASDSRRAAAN